MKIDIQKTKKIGIDGLVLLIPKFKTKNNLIFLDNKGRRRMNKLSIPYKKNRIDSFTLTLSDDGLIVNLCIPKFLNDHNLYYSDTEETFKIIKLLKKQLKNLGFITKFKNFLVKDIEIGTNFINSDIANEEEDIFSHIASALSLKHRGFKKIYKKSYLPKQEREINIGYGCNRGFKKFKIYDKTRELIENQGISINSNVTRLELTISSSELVSKLSTTKLSTVLKVINFIFVDKINKAFLILEKLDLEFKEFLRDEILDFKRRKKPGLVKHLVKFNFIKLETVEDVLKELNKKLGWNSKRYIQQIKKLKKDNFSKIEDFKRRVSLFFHVETEKVTWMGNESNNFLATISIDLNTVFGSLKKVVKSTLSKGHEILSKPFQGGGLIEFS